MKIFSKLFKGLNLGNRNYGFMKKTRLQKSHATVPLRVGAMNVGAMNEGYRAIIVSQSLARNYF